MSKVWSFMIIISISIALVTGNAEIVINSIMNNSKLAIENILNLMGMMCFWSGIFNIFEKTYAVKSFSKKFSKIISKIFNKEEINEKVAEYMSMNICSNIVGIGNAATLNGIRAMEEMQKINKEKDNPNNSMTTFILLNTASLQLLPTSIIALRVMYGSISPTSIIIPVWIVTIFALIFGMIAIKLLNRKMV